MTEDDWVGLGLDGQRSIICNAVLLVTLRAEQECRESVLPKVALLLAEAGQAGSVHADDLRRLAVE